MGIFDFTDVDQNSLQAAQQLGLAQGLLSGGRGGPALGTGVAGMMQAKQNWQADQMAKMRAMMEQLQIAQTLRQQQALAPIYELAGRKAAAMGGVPAGVPMLSGMPSNPSQMVLGNAATWNATPTSSGAFGLNDNALVGATLGGPAELGKAIVAANSATDFNKQLIQAGIDPSSALGRQLQQQQIAKTNYIAPASFRPGGYTQDAAGNVRQLPHIPEGFQAIADPSTEGGWRIIPVGGGLEAMQASANATAAGKGAVEPVTAYDAQGNPVFTNKTAAARGGLAAAPAAQSAPGTQAPTASGLDISRLTPQQAAYLRQADPQAFANGMEDFIRSGGVSGAQAAPGTPDAGNASRLAPAQAPGFTDFTSKLAGAAGQRYTDLISQAQDSKTRVNVLDNILNLSRQGALTGPNQEFMNHIKGMIADSPALGALFPQGWTGSVANYQELKKFMGQNALRSWQSAGGTGTNAQLDAQTEANLNKGLFPQALQGIAEWNKGGELALQGKANAADAFLGANGQTPGAQTRFESAWRNNFDPLLYQLKAMEPAQAAATVATMKAKNPSAYANLMLKAKALQNLGGM
jgi:hypothetical protein